MSKRTFRGGPFDGWPVLDGDVDYPQHAFPMEHPRVAFYDHRFIFMHVGVLGGPGRHDRQPNAEYIGKIPTWLTRAVRAAIRRGDLKKLLPGKLSKHDAIYAIANDSRFRRICDHWGSDCDRFVMEPYAEANDLGISADSEHLALILRCDFAISSERATWNPGRTVRIEFWPVQVLVHETE